MRPLRPQGLKPPIHFVSIRRHKCLLHPVFGKILVQLNLLNPGAIEFSFDRNLLRRSGLNKNAVRI